MPYYKLVNSIAVCFFPAVLLFGAVSTKLLACCLAGASAFALHQVVKRGLVSWLTIGLISYLGYKVTYYALSNGPFVFFQSEFLSTEARFFLPLIMLVIASCYSIDIRKSRQSLMSAAVICVLGSLTLSSLSFDTLVSLRLSHHLRGGLAIGALVYILLSCDDAVPRFSKGTILFAAGGAVLAVLLSDSRSNMVLALPIFIFIFYRVFGRGNLNRFVFFVLIGGLFLSILISVDPGKLRVSEGRQLNFAIFDEAAYFSRLGYEYGEAGDLAKNLEDYADLNRSNDFNVSSRFFLFGKAFREFLDRPFVGKGVGRFDDPRSVCFDRVQRDCWLTSSAVVLKGATAHNTFLHLAVEEGILGLILFAFLLKGLFSASPWSTSSRTLLMGVFLLSCAANHSLGSPIQVVSILCPLIIFSHKSPCGESALVSPDRYHSHLEPV